MSSLEDRYSKIQQKLKGYPKAELLAVSKYTTDENIQKLYDLGHRDFGENRVPELLERSSRFPSDMNWHFIGNIQSNKLNKLFQVEGLCALHSIDRLSILEKILKSQALRKIDIHLQFNTSGESEKAGFEDLSEVIEAIKIFQNANNDSFQLKGLMTMAAIRTDDYLKDARECFEKLAEIRKEIDSQFPELDLILNMGMSRDYQLALELGSQLIRVGSTLFDG